MEGSISNSPSYTGVLDKHKKKTLQPIPAVSKQTCVEANGYLLCFSFLFFFKMMDVISVESGEARFTFPEQTRDFGINK